MCKSKVKVFKGKNHEDVEKQANKYAEEHYAEIQSADFVVHTIGITTQVYLTVVFKVSSK